MSSAAQRDLDLHAVWRAVRHRRAVVLVALVATMGAAWFVASQQTPTYQSTSQMRVGLGGTNLFGSVGDEDISAELALATAMPMMGTDVVQDRVRELLGVEQDAAIPGASGGQLGDSDLIAITVRSGDPVAAQAFANAYVVAFGQYRAAKLQRDLGQQRQGLEELLASVEARLGELQAELEALEPASEDDPRAESAKVLLETSAAGLRSQRTRYQAQLEQLRVDTELSSAGVELVSAAGYGRLVEPRTRRTLVLAGGAGLLLGLAAAVAFDLLDDRIRTRRDVERATDAAVLASVPHVPRRHAAWLELGSLSSPVMETYRTLRANIQLRSAGAPLKVIMITSPRSGDGKTTTAINLAATFARSGRRVVIVDGDLRAPRLADRLGLERSIGLTEVLEGSALEGALVPFNGSGVPKDSLWVLPSGTQPAHPGELMAARQRLQAVVNELRNGFSYVIIDSPPVLLVSDYGVLSHVADGVVVVVRAGRSVPDDLKEALERLDLSPSESLGIVMNAVREDVPRSLHRAKVPRGRRRFRSRQGDFVPNELRPFRPDVADESVAVSTAVTISDVDHPARVYVQGPGKK